MKKYTIEYHNELGNLTTCEVQADDVAVEHGWLIFKAEGKGVLLISPATKCTVHPEGNGVYDEE